MTEPTPTVKARAIDLPEILLRYHAFSAHQISSPAPPHDSELPLKVGSICRELESITLEGLSLVHPKHTKECGNAQNLRSLSLTQCGIRGRHMAVFWTICQRLETLHLNHVFMDTTKALDVDSKPHDSMPPIAMALRFPRLRELSLRNMIYHQEHEQLNLICHCSLLQTLTWSKLLQARDIIDAKPFVCLQLQELQVFIDLRFPYHRFTKDELHQCRAVFKRLSIFTNLRELDLVSINDPSHPRQNMVGLPLRVRAGLSHLSGLKKLEAVYFSGRQKVHKEDLIWMIDHWKSLRRLTGTWQVLFGNKDLVRDDFFHEGKLQQWLKEHGIQTDGCRYEFYNPGDMGIVDCCGSSDDEQEDIDGAPPKPRSKSEEKA
ncbi:hypothetical protein BCR41DRAFT_418099 [Lobosporangium transversale]|uniref:F-box domain-containing protein n=1 Tax=Lobosporangium transversale TaxID=64571 RepID=A0A1Y2H3A7_9FUNG|nr:hypothetical protein BCR41DRAFT_418099 [Lobosporangium transversale]ORZ29016.1 hypothetical protein BCR41DRAFT_418099 [Lobosporangium transversale]|eukprot:XP_021886689.1 hypothetical protein BCR41DRAFT_418099 [Lobosporangium transversale]